MPSVLLIPVGAISFTFVGSREMVEFGVLGAVRGYVVTVAFMG
jgi:hypothetical protein